MVFQSELGFFGGSKLLTPVAEVVGIPIDQVNFLVCQLIAFSLGFPFRNLLSAEKVGVRTRHYVETIIGVLLTLFCFGSQIWHLLAQSFVSYLCLMLGGKSMSHTLVFVFTMVYLSVCHIYRQVYDYGGYTLDITGPLMIQTQKLTSLAFALHDGRYKQQEDLSVDQRSQAVRKLPSLLQYYSYLFCFHGIMVGPMVFFNDYNNFVEEKYLTENEGHVKKPTHNLNWLLLKKVLIAVACCGGMMTLPKFFFPPEKLNSMEFYSWNFPYKVFFVLGAMTFAKHKYYFAWKLADAVNNAAGFGFSGYDSQGNPNWDLTDNVDIWGVEMSTSLKVNIDSWNKNTTLWLRRVVYDRAKGAKTLAVFACSAFWHGFYPGYYVTFGTGALMTVVARQVRRNVRPWFQQSPSLSFIYDILTFVATRLANCYICFPFLVLEFYACFNMYRSMYFFYHILSILTLVCFHFLPMPASVNTSSNKGTTSKDVRTISRTSTSGSRTTVHPGGDAKQD